MSSYSLKIWFLVFFLHGPFASNEMGEYFFGLMVLTYWLSVDKVFDVVPHSGYVEL